MYKNNILSHSNLEEEARKRRTYNPNPEQKTDPAVEAHYKAHNICQHTEIIKKSLFTTDYFECKQCGKEV